MKRKRYVKLMMSKGLSRNEANLLAYVVRNYNGVGLPYSCMIDGVCIARVGKDIYIRGNDLSEDRVESYREKERAIRSKRHNYGWENSAEYTYMEQIFANTFKNYRKEYL